MPKRKNVKLNLDIVIPVIKMKCRSNVVFCEKMGRKQYWVTDWGRNKNLPSPEEAARMCAILQVTPEEILTEPEDIALVQSLIDSQRGERQKKDPLPDGRELSDLEYIRSRLPHMSKDDLATLMAELPHIFMEK